MKNKGITLVALVVAIVIMLILSGITLRLSLGENGLIKMTQTTAEKYGEAQRDEQSALKELEGELHASIKDGKDDETPGKMTGEGTEESPYLIESIEDLIELSNQVKSGVTYKNQTIKLMVNLDFKSDNSYVDYKSKKYGDINGINDEEELKTELTTGKGFPSIGNDTIQFQGSFDGQNRTISNLYINVAENYKGLFGYVGSNGNINNLTLSNVNVNCDGEYIGILAGYTNGGIIENVNIKNGLLQGNRYVGSIAGYLESRKHY